MAKINDPNYAAGYEDGYNSRRRSAGICDGARAAKEQHKAECMATGKSALALTERHTLRSVSDQGKTRAFRFASTPVQPQAANADKKFADVLAQLQRIRVKLSAAPRNASTQGVRSQQAIMRDVSTILHHGDRR